MSSPDPVSVHGVSDSQRQILILCLFMVFQISNTKSDVLILILSVYGFAGFQHQVGHADPVSVYGVSDFQHQVGNTDPDVCLWCFRFL